jgi:hypothetical protein
MGVFHEMSAVDPLRFTHAFIVLDETTAMEPWPTGARLVGLAKFATSPVAYVWLPDLDDKDRDRLVAAALALDGTPYRVRDMGALLMWRLGRRGVRTVRTVTDRRYLTPGQFVAETYRRAAVPMFDDPHGITIGDLTALIVAVEQWHQRVPTPDVSRGGAAS